MSTLLDRIRSTDIPDQPRDEFSVEMPDELAAEIAEDPQPGKGKTPAPKPARTPRPARPRASAAARKRCADELEAFAKMAALALSVRDEHCGGVLNDQSRAIADSLAELLARNPALMQWVESSGMVGDWLKLWFALQPVVMAFRDHHVLKRVGDDQGAGGADAPDYSQFVPYRGA